MVISAYVSQWGVGELMMLLSEALAIQLRAQRLIHTLGLKI